MHEAAPTSFAQNGVKGIPRNGLPPRPARGPISTAMSNNLDDMRQVAAESLGEVCFRHNGRRANGLEVKLSDLVDLHFEP